MPPVLGQELTLTIERDGDEGYGVARHEGMVVFVKHALRGERVSAHVREVNKRFARADTLKVLEASPHRTEPPCPYYEACGGCCALHMDYAYALALLEERVIGCMERIGGVARGTYRLLPTLHMDDPFRYRNKAVFHREGERVGFKRKSSHEVADIERCLLLPDALNAVLERLRAENVPFTAASARVSRRGEVMARVDGSPYIGGDALRDAVCGMEVAISPESFQQVNPAQADRLYAAALEVAGEGALCVDAFCGGGLLTMLLARRFERAVGIEIVPQAIEDARQGALNNGVTNVGFVCGAVEDVLPAMIARGDKPDCVVFDPPRAGVDARALRAAMDAGVGRVVYISCDPATLARDVKILGEGGHALEILRVVDMFPWTGHVEAVASLSRFKR